MLTTELGKLVYNHIQHGIYIRIRFHSKGGQTTDQAAFTFKYPRNIQRILYRQDDFWYQLWVTW